jgi:hypothetical protein
VNGALFRHGELAVVQLYDASGQFVNMVAKIDGSDTLDGDVYF